MVVLGYAINNWTTIPFPYPTTRKYVCKAYLDMQNMGRLEIGEEKFTRDRFKEKCYYSTSAPGLNME